jgi:hypothetical protein
LDHPQIERIEQGGHQIQRKLGFPFFEFSHIKDLSADQISNRGQGAKILAVAAIRMALL